MNTVQTPSTVVLPDGRVCPRCGAPLGGFGPEGLCGACLFDSGLRADPPEVATEPVDFSAQRFGDYEIIEEIARGGMGLVLKARHLTLNRIVALKLIRAGDLAGPLELQRFREEAQTVAGLQHPNIVALHEAGERDGQPFFSMDYVEGQTLAQLVRDNPLPAARAAGYLKTVAEAVHYAHEHGVLHRDLKPSNVLIDLNDQPRVTDFGLAKQLAGDASLTLTGQIIGSPSFMPPEQAAGKHGVASPASDVYSLGALLYHLLTGRPPFVAETVPATLRLVTEREPVAPHLLNASVPRDLETICLKCLEKYPARRYAKAQELADDLRRFLHHEPILARPVGQAEKFWRWCRQNRSLAASGGAVVILLVTVAVGSLVAIVRINRERARAEQSALAETHQRQRAEDLVTQNRRRLYATRINLAYQIFGEGDVTRAEELLRSLQPQRDEEDLRGFEWRYLRGLGHSEVFNFIGHTGFVRAVAFSPDGRTLAAGGNDAVVRLWDAITGKERARLAGHTNTVTGVAFAPDGKSLASVSADGTARLWNPATGASLGVLWSETNPLRTVAFSPDGRMLAAGTAELATGEGLPGRRFLGGPHRPVHHITLWNMEEGKVAHELGREGKGNYALAFSPDGKTLATGGRGGEAALWDMDTGQGRVVATNFSEPIFGLGFSPDSQHFAAASWLPLLANGEVKILDSATADELPIRIDLPGPVTCLAWAADGRTIATAGVDQLVRLWDAKTGGLRAKFAGHGNIIWSLAWSPDSQRLASASWDGSVRLWDVTRHQDADRFPTLANYSAAFSPDGRTLASGGTTVELWDAASGKHLRTLAELSGHDINVAFSPAGDTLAAGGYEGVIHLWDLNGWRHLGTLPGAARRIFSLAFSADGKTLAVSARDHTVRLYDVPGRSERVRLKGITDDFATLAFTPDGQMLITGGNNRAEVIGYRNLINPLQRMRLTGRLRFWDAHTGKERASFGEDSLRPAVSPDGRKLAVANSKHEVRIFDLAIMTELLILKGHQDEIHGIAFSPDGRTLATASWDGTVRLWQVSSGEPLLTFRSAYGVSSCVAFSPDNRTLAFGSGLQIPPGGEITLLRAPTDKETPPGH